jgi:cytidine deaminase
MDPGKILLNVLWRVAADAALRAHAPYSGLKVGAAVRTTSLVGFPGCNMESASYGLSLCAERSAINRALLAGVRPGHMSGMVIYTPGQDRLLSPCGACRQVMAEYLEPGSLVVSCNDSADYRSWRLDELIPDAFTL